MHLLGFEIGLVWRLLDLDGNIINLMIKYLSD